MGDTQDELANHSSCMIADRVQRSGCYICSIGL